MTVEPIRAVRINAPEWFAREDFRAWLNTPGTATWHDRTGGVPGEYSDAFVNFDHGDGADSDFNQDGLPADIWLAICIVCQEAAVEYGVVWISPV